MQGQLNPKIIGATVIGFALVAGTYTVLNFGKPRLQNQSANVQTTSPTQRVAIGVSDKDNNGIEDWRDEFITTAPVIINQASSTYTPPDTLTGKMGIDFMEGIIRAKGYGAFGKTNEEVIGNTVNKLVKDTETKFYGVSDIIIMKQWDDQDIVNYANTAATTVYKNNVPNIKETGLTIFSDYLRNRDEKRLDELKTLAKVFRGYRDDTLKIPVPEYLAKEHLDLINSYQAMYTDLEAMTQSDSDPALALLRLKRYEDDGLALAYSMQNIYLALEPKAGLFSANDPAPLFVIFSPNYQNQ